MELVHRFCAVAIMSLSLTLITPGMSLAEAEISVVPRSEIAEIGQDLVLEVTVAPAAGETVLNEDLKIEVTPGEGQEFFGAPYPVKLLSPPGSEPAA